MILYLISNVFLQTFDHIINGQLHQIDRGKPKLLVTAVPSYNLPTEDIRDLKRKHDGGETNRKSKKQHVIGNDVAKLMLTDELTRTRRPIIKRLLKDFNDKRTKENVAVHNTQRHSEVNENMDETIVIDEINSTTDDQINEQLSISVEEAPYAIQDDDDVEEESSSFQIKGEQTEELNYDCVDEHLFDGIYEDIYEVTLPNTLWGIHRDPNRTFIVFSYFDNKTCSTSKLIHLDNSMNTHVYVKGKLVNKYMSNLSIEYLTNLVSQVDEYRICDKFDFNSKCDVVTVEQNLCPACQ